MLWLRKLGGDPLNPPSLRGPSGGSPRAPAGGTSSQARYPNVRTLPENLDRVLVVSVTSVTEAYQVTASPLGTSLGLALQTLKSLQGLCSVSFGAYSSVDQWNNLGQSSNRAGKDVYLLVDLNLYGLEKARSALGQYLPSKHTYLQHPGYQDENTLYDNPHFLQIPGVAPGIVAADREALGNQIVNEDSETSKVSMQIQIDETLTAVFESLTRFKCLKRLEADNRVRTLQLP